MLILPRNPGQSVRISTNGIGYIWATMLRHGVDITFQGGNFHIEKITPSPTEMLGGWDITDESGTIVIIRRLAPMYPDRTPRIGINAPKDYTILREELIHD